MAFCPFCGKEIPAGASFCPACGKSIAAGAASSVPGQLPPVPAGARPNLATEGDRIIAVIIDTSLIYTGSQLAYRLFWKPTLEARVQHMFAPKLERVPVDIDNRIR